MARRSAVLAPSAASLPDTFRVPASTSALVKSLSRLSRSSLVALVLQWLDDKHLATCRPYLSSDAKRRTARSVGEDADDVSLYDTADSIEELRDVYAELLERKGGKREVVDRILDGDWRHGLTLRQLAMADIRYIEDHSSASHRWTALQFVLQGGAAESKHATAENSTPLPRFNGPTFLKLIQNEISPLVKAHYYISHSATLPLTFVRIFVIDSPYQYPRQTPHAFTDASRIIYLVFPDSSPFIYSSLFSIPAARNASAPARSHTTDVKTLRRIVIDAVPKALSRPQQRYTLRLTSLTTKNLHTLLSLRGPWRSNAANGAFSIFADAVAEQGPLDPRPPESIAVGDAETQTAEKENIPRQSATTAKRRTRRQSDLDDIEPELLLKRQKTVISRFGTTDSSRQPLTLSSSSATTSTTAAAAAPTSNNNPTLEKLEIRLQDPISTTGSSSPGPPTASPQATLTLTFSGSDVISGLRKLAEMGVIDAARMPAWMTGEEGVSSAAVKGGKRVVEDTL
ncbi:chromosome loss- protein [Ophidiomyces ophidiicola]|nr:chromosome loss- protein [Ophidiomyces ophidiicola]